MMNNILRQLAQELSTQFPDQANQYALRLLCLVLAITPTQYYALSSDFILSDEQAAKLNKLKSELKSGRPIQQLEGYVEFCGYKIAITDDVLIPRPETEYMTELFLKEIDGLNLANINILELGSGSGCITTAIVGHLLQSKIKFHYVISEVSNAAIACTVKNLSTFNPKVSQDGDNYTLEVGLSKISIYHKSLSEIGLYDLQAIISNPPYIELAEYEKLDQSVKNFEPRVALTDEADGTTIYRGIGDYISNLSSLPLVYLELSPTIAEAVKDIFDKLYTPKMVQLLTDQYQKLRFLIARPI